MYFKNSTLTDYERASGLQPGQLLSVLMPLEREKLRKMGYRPRCLLPAPALAYLKEIFPLPDANTKLVSMTVYEKNCGFSKGELLKNLSEEERETIEALGYRSHRILPYRVVLYLRELGYH